ncbi:MAG: hypothetical protein EOO56_27700 [Hymenobacter sp.]|nr:MAG: hypothetical protein EOO56_27700 [Hymenobacter sp.]
MEDSYFTEPGLPKPAIYSPQALVGFSAVFSALAGGILAHHSLRAAGQPAAARHALWTSIGFLAFTILLGQVVPRIPGLGLALGYAWGYWLGQYLRKYVPDEASYPRKKIIKPLLICLLVTGVIIGSVFMVFHGYAQ